MGILLPKEKHKDATTIHYHNVASKNLLLIFTRNPVLGKCKTRLAATIGDKKALDIYQFLLRHTVSITKNLAVAKQVYYSEEIWEDDLWNTSFFDKKLQQGADLGARMALAFQDAFSSGYEKICIIGSDMYNLQQTDIENAFSMLNTHDYVIGPALDGGYYLLGMKAFNSDIFKNKQWGQETVLDDTLQTLKNETVHLLGTKNDIDLYEDIKDIEVFQPYLKDL